MCQVETHGEASGAVVVRCVGEIDLAGIRDVQEAIDRSLGTGVSVVRLDLTDVSFIDVCGARCVMECERRCVERRFGFEVAASPVVERTFGLLGLRSLGVEAP